MGRANTALKTYEAVVAVPRPRQSMRVRRPRARRSDDRRDRLLDLGRTIFAEHAYDQISIDDIANLAGVSRGLLYHYFPGKWQFYVATMRDVAQRLRDTIRAESEAPPHGGMLTSLDAVLRFVEQNGMLYSSLMHGGARSDAEVSEALEDARALVIAQVLARDPVGAGGPIFSGAVRGWMSFVEAAALNYADHPEVGSEKVRQLAVDVLKAVVASAARLESA